MIHGHPVIEADSHKCENPVVFLDYPPCELRDRIGFLLDRLLGCGLGDLYRRARTVLEIPPAIEWMEADPRLDA